MKRCRPSSRPNSRSAPVPAMRTSAAPARPTRGCSSAHARSCGGPHAMLPARRLLAPQVDACRASRGARRRCSTSLVHATWRGARVGRVHEQRGAGPLRAQCGEQPEQIAAELVALQRSRRRSDRPRRCRARAPRGTAPRRCAARLAPAMQRVPQRRAAARARSTSRAISSPGSAALPVLLARRRSRACASSSRDLVAHRARGGQRELAIGLAAQLAERERRAHHAAAGRGGAPPQRDVDVAGVLAEARAARACVHGCFVRRADGQRAAVAFGCRPSRAGAPPARARAASRWRRSARAPSSAENPPSASALERGAARCRGSRRSA